MKMIFLAALISGLLPCSAQAQCGEYTKGQGYAYVGAGGPSFGSVNFNFGGGGEGFMNRYVGVGVEVGYVAESGESKKRAGILSPDFVARFPGKDKQGRAEPFITGGYTVFYRSVTEYRLNPGGYSYSAFDVYRFQNGLNLGTGFSWWFKNRTGLRFEIRDNILMARFERKHYVSVHIGLTFR